jgi:hypothetical protein
MDLFGLYWPQTSSSVNIILTGPYITYWPRKKSIIDKYTHTCWQIKCIFSFHEQRYMYHFPIITIWYLLKSIGCTRLECGRLCVRVPIGSNKDYNIGIFCFPAKHAALRNKNTDWLARNQENVSEWDDMYIRGLLHYINRSKRIVLVQSGPNYHLIET